ncbi:MAG TPA: DUF1573 domain-containing protein [Pirellulaceae bacterium]|nr:DUF1573 domain-containing protein [Pirellulaceae bacterium]HMO92919.1 DUF1573 domain-containing protein [Pirellulaceae bacterium]HMP71060.1 DUF1573 domain-containing protein [Pirellulaceae bacterium]
MSGCHKPVSKQGQSAIGPVIELKCLPSDNEVVRGQVCERTFEFCNLGETNVQIQQVSTSCGCAVVQTEGLSQHMTIGSGERIRYRVRIDTAQRIGPLHVGLLVQAKSSIGEMHQCKATASLFVNPAWVTDKKVCRFVQQVSQSEQYEDSFYIYATTPKLAFDSITVSVSNPLIDARLEPVADDAGGRHAIDTRPLVEKELYLRPVAICRLSTAFESFRQREESVLVEFGSEMVPLSMPIQYSPLKPPLACEPDQITLFESQRSRVGNQRQFVLRSEFPIEDLEIVPTTTNILILSTDKITDGVYLITISLSGSLVEAAKVLITSKTTGDSIHLPVFIVYDQN